MNYKGLSNSAMLDISPFGCSTVCVTKKYNRLISNPTNDKLDFMTTLKKNLLLPVLIFLALLLIGIFAFLINRNINFSVNSSPKQKYVYINKIEKTNNTYLFYLREIDWLKCTNIISEVTKDLPECNPNGYLLGNEKPEKIYTVHTPDKVYYRAPIGNEEGLTENMGTIPLEEFYRNFVREEDTIISKHILFRGIDGLYKVTTNEQEILDIEGIYTP
jgi:hypothetical protein